MLVADHGAYTLEPVSVDDLLLERGVRRPCGHLFALAEVEIIHGVLRKLPAELRLELCLPLIASEVKRSLFLFRVGDASIDVEGILVAKMVVIGINVLLVLVG